VPLFEPYGVLDYFFTSMSVGIRSLASPYLREAAARIVNPLSYPRHLEYQLALGQLGPLEGCRVLDIGSPKLPVLLLARHARCDLYATDIRDYFIASTTHFLSRMGMHKRIGKDLHLEAQDARALTYPDSYFDKVYAISAIEHIPADGDAQAMREIARVLRPGGVATLTVPFHGAGYHEEFINGPVYERAGDGGPTFYQRHYDLAAVRNRLVEPSGLRLIDMTLFGEPTVRFESTWNRIPMRWKAPLLWAQPFIAKLFLKRLPPERLDAAVGVGLTLTKP
jgi:SAM-dependent methyltransferase